MLTNIIYFAVFLILVFVLSIAVKAITRGVEAKQIIKEEKNEDSNLSNEKQNIEVVDQIKELKNLHDQGILSEQEFKKAKDKILK
jgi:cytochrome c-type biogenesis protein CcmH/NrfG